MPQESGDLPSIGSNTARSQEHGDRFAVDDAWTAIAQEVIGAGGIEGLTKVLSDPTEPLELKEHALTQLCSALLSRGMEVQREIDAGNPSKDPNIETLREFNSALADPVEGPKADRKAGD